MGRELSLSLSPDGKRGDFGVDFHAGLNNSRGWILLNREGALDEPPACACGLVRSSSIKANPTKGRELS